MNPKKPNTFIKQTAEETGVSEETVKEVVNYYWARVRNSLAELKHHSVKVSNLGTFKIRANKIQKEIEKNEDIARHSDPTEFRQYAIHTHASDKLVKLKNLVVLIEEEKEKRLSIKNLRQ